MRFVKMQGLGNDYIFLNCLERPPEGLPELAKKLSDRHFGVGGDGLICVCPSETADFRMRMFNADGSEGRMCGNGIRCLGKLVYDQGLTDKTELRVDTLAGVKTLTLHTRDGQVSSVQVDMGPPGVEAPVRVFTQRGEVTGRPVDMGNPHLVVYRENLDALPIAALGQELEQCSRFPDRTNVEFVRVEDRTALSLRVWERGSGETLACGTGACAAAVTAITDGRMERKVTVLLRGGALSVRWDGGTAPVYMTGPAVTVFEGDWPERAP